MTIPSFSLFLEAKPLYYKEIDHLRVHRAYASLAEKIHHPETIHIIGTNGKGSTGRMIAHLAYQGSGSGFSVGHFSSPHLLSFNERIWLDGKDVDDEVLERAHRKLYSILGREMSEALSYFEYTTLLALVVFEHCDLIVLEAGLGGEYDATSVCNRVLSVVTPIDMDHQAFLGESIEAIASTKIRSIQKRALLAPQPWPEVLEIAKKIAGEKRAELYLSTRKSDSPEPERSLPPNTKEPETSVLSDVSEAETSLPSDTLESETSVPPNILESETSLLPDTPEPETSVPLDVLEPERSLPPKVCNRNDPINPEALRTRSISPEKQRFLEEIAIEKGWPAFLQENALVAMQALDLLKLVYRLDDLRSLELFGRFYPLSDNIRIDVGHNPLAAKAIVEALEGPVVLLYNSLEDKEYERVLQILKPKIKRVEILPITSQRAATVESIRTALEQLDVPFGDFNGECDPGEDYLIFGSFYTVEAFIKRRKKRIDGTE